MENALKMSLLEDMKSHPWKYKEGTLRILFDGITVTDDHVIDYLRSEDSLMSRFILSGQVIEYDDLINNSVVPPSIGKGVLISQGNLISSQDQVVEEIDSCMDVFFLGYGWSAKTYVMASVLEQIYVQGIASYVYSTKTVRYYHELLGFIRGRKLPICVNEDSSYYVTCNHSGGNLRFICNCDYFFHLNNGCCCWSELEKRLPDFTNSLKTKNKKILFFLIDSSVLLENEGRLKSYDYIRSIENIIFTFCRNGHGKDGANGCTISFVSNIVLLFINCEMIELNLYESIEDRMRTYVEENMMSLYRLLECICMKYGINVSLGMKPLIMKHSIGNVYIGNTFEYNPEDAKSIVHFLMSQMPHPGFFGKLKKIFA